MTAPEATELVVAFWPLACSTARRWSRYYPNLAEDFESDAILELWRAALAFERISGHNGAFVQFLRRRLRWRLKSCLQKSHRQRLINLDSSAGLEGESVTPLDAVPDDAKDVGAELEAAEELNHLFSLVNLTHQERERLEQHVCEGVSLRELALREGVTPEALFQRTKRTRDKLRAAVEGDDRPT